MATKIVTKNSSTASAVPTASDLVQGELAVNVADKRLFTEDNAGAIVELGTNPSGNVTFQDNGKAIFGAGDDLQIYHDGSNSYINDAGTGNLYLRASNAIIMQSADGAETIASFHDDNLCRLYFDNAEKLATTSTGINVTGNLTMASGGSIVAGGANDLILNAGESGTPDIYLQSGSSTKVKIEGSSGNVGIGTSSPSRALATKSSSVTVANFESTSATAGFISFSDSNTTNDVTVRAGAVGDNLVLQAGGAERMRISSAGTLITKGGAVFNEDSADADFRVESDTDANAFFVQGSNGFVGMGTGSPVSITGAAGPVLDMQGPNPEIVFHDNNGTANSMSMYYLNDTLKFWGDGAANLTLTNAGNLTVAGALSKGSGSFKIDHPLPAKTETHNLVHSFIEGPQADNIYRGKVTLVDGSATVNIDTVSGMSEGTYVLLNTNTQCFTSNESGWTAVKGSVSGNILTITAQESCTDTISWMVVGERHDQHMLDTEWTDENGKVIVEPLKQLEE